MKLKNRKKLRVFSFIALILFGIYFLELEQTKAASSYTNAREFYESSGGGPVKQHIEVNNGYIYYATNAKLASSSSNLKYSTVGYDITLSGNGQSINIAVKRGGTLGEVSGSSVEYGGYQYLLYRISYEDIQKLAKSNNNLAAEAILDSTLVTVRMNAIITTRKGEDQHGDIEENGDGTLSEWGTIYHLGDSSDLATARGVFSGHTFDSYIKIDVPLKNNTLTIKYNLQGGNVSNGYTTQDDMLYHNGSLYKSQHRQMREVTLVDQSSIGLNRTGYHIEAGREWTTDNRYFNQSKTYMPIDLSPSIAQRSKMITMYANWQANTYAVSYDSNGGTGYMMNSACTYDTASKLRPLGYSRKGYNFKGWNTERDGNGTAYADQQSITNLSSENGAIITLYAQWEATIYTFSTNKQGGTGGTDKFYEKYNTGWYADKAGKNLISTLIVPSKAGYEFTGYYTGLFGFGTGIANGKGNMLVNPDYYQSDGTIYGNWKAKEYNITFDRQGGTGGTAKAKVTYNASLPEAVAPTRTGYTFQGYFTKTGGKGVKYYNENMVGMQRYQTDGDITLYAYWLDQTAPEITLNANIEIWTKKTIVLSADASDAGSGLSSVAIYQGNTKVAEKTGLNGAKTYTLKFNNAKEGALTYKAIAIDMAGNKAESYKTIYFDKTAPKGEVTSENRSGTNLEIEVFVTDYKVEE